MAGDASGAGSLFHDDDSPVASPVPTVLLLPEPALIFTTLAVVLAALFLLGYHCCCRSCRTASDRSAMGIRSSKPDLAGPDETSPTGKQVLNDALSGNPVPAAASGGGDAAGGPASRSRTRAPARRGGGGAHGGAVVGDKKKFEDPTVIESMQNIAEEDKERFRRFDEWLVEHGTNFPDLEYQQYADGVRGVHTTKPIPAMVQLMAIPKHLLITDSMARETERGKRLRKVEPQLSVPNHCQVIVFMMHGIAEGNTFFQPYYDVLPKNFNNFPIFWDSRMLGWLRGSSLVDEIEERKLNMRNDYNTICKALPEFKRFSFREFLWCRTAVGSRNFSIVIGEEKVTAMVPFADMLNHYRPRETSWRFDNSQEAFTMTSLCPLAGGHQVMDSYGKKCNSKFLLHYGFTIEDNREADGKCQNEVQVNFRLLPEPDPLRKLRLKFVHKTLITRMGMNADGAGTMDAFLFARVAVATEKELMYWLDNADDDQSPEMPINPTNEIRALEFVAEECAARLAKYPSTEAEDEQIIAAEPPFSDRRHAAIVIRSEKQVLRFYTELLAEARPLLQMPPQQRNREVRQMGPATDVTRYLETLNTDLLEIGK